MDEERLEDAVLDHLQVIAHAKKAMLQAAVEVAHEYPTQAGTLLRVIQELTKSADKLLGDTVTSDPG